MSICSLSDCLDKIYAKGLCSKHYQRVKRNGHTDICRITEAHSMSGTKEYCSWQAMKDRCYNPNNDSYVRYGGKGVEVCDDWIKSFVNFYNDMGNSSIGMTLDRIDPRGNYEPNNCRWANKTIQARNQGLSKNNSSGCKGVNWNKAYGKWKARIHLNYKEIHLGYFSKLEDAVKTRKEAELKYWVISDLKKQNND